MSRPLVKVVFEHAIIDKGGDVGPAEIYFEGWVDDGAGTRKTFRIPHAGAIPGVKDGQKIDINTTIFESSDAVVGEQLLVHLEAWDEDLGRQSLTNPDDLLGTYEQVFDASSGFGVGRHVDLPLKSAQGAWRLTFRIEAKSPVGAADADHYEDKPETD